MATSSTLPARTRSLQTDTPQSRSLPASPNVAIVGNVELWSHRSGDEGKASTVPQSPILKRKSGLSNLAETRPSGSPRVSRSTVRDAILSSSSQNPTRRTRSSKIHSFAFDFDPYLDRLHQTGAQTFHASYNPRQISTTDASRRHDHGLTSFEERTAPGTSDSPSPRPPRSNQTRSTTKSGSVRRSLPAGSVLSGTSTPSLSRFPLPPTSINPSDPYSSEDRDDPGTPTIYHFRGASFEFVNPRHSLRLQNIETPGEQDGDRLEYFPDGHKEVSRPGTLGFPPFLPPPPSSTMDHSNHRSTPPRSLFDDLPSAYNSIRKNGKSPSPMQDLPVPPTPLRSQEGANQDRHGFASTDNLLDVEADTQIRRPSPAVSFRKRFSQVFRLKGRDSTHQDDNGISDRDQSSVSETNPHIRVTSRSTEVFDTRSVKADTGMGTQPDDDEDPRSTKCGVPRSRSTSFHPETIHPSSHDLRRSYGMLQGDSTEDLIASYGDEFGDPSRSSAGSNVVQKHRSMPIFETRMSTPTTNKQADSTIGEILEQYHNQDTSFLGHAHSPARQHDSTAKVGTLYDSKAMGVTDQSLEEFAFDFKRNKLSQQSENDIKFEAQPDENIRAATARALDTPRRTAPLLPLPPDPSRDLKKPLTGRTSRELSANSSNQSGMSYEDTRRLLLLSQPSIELGRGVNNTTSPALLSSEWQRSGRTHLAPTQTPQHLSTSVEESDHRASGTSCEEIVTRDIRYLSRLSGLSNFQGSVYMLGSASSAQGRNSGQTKAESHAPPNSRKSGQMQRREPREPSQASCLPIAAFQQSAVVPGIQRLHTADRAAFERGDHSGEKVVRNGRSSDGEESNDSRDDISENYSAEDSIKDDADDGVDWETLPESRPTLRSRKTNDDSFAEWSSRSSLNTFRNVNAHPGDNLLQHGYRLHTPANSDGPVLIPAYEFRGDTGFPNRNALTPPTPAIHNTYKHPVPLSQAYENPFTSSPPQITGTPRAKTPLLGAHSEPVTISTPKKNENLPFPGLRHKNLSVVHEQNPETPTSKKSFGLFDSLRKLSNSGKFSKASSQPSSGWLSSNADHEVSVGAEHGSPAEEQSCYPRSTKLSSGVDPALVHVLRQGDHRLASSPLSATNSFARVSRLGPRGNVTGTPNGTGMREVGSSVVGSSSPAGIPNSSPPVPQYSTPMTETSACLSTPRIALTNNVDSPLSRFNGIQNGDNGQITASKQHRGQSFRDALVAESKAERQARRAVPGQRELIEMTLHPTKCDIKAPEAITPTFELPSPTGGAHEQLLPLPVTTTSLPKLRERYRSPSSFTSNLKDRKQKISWVCFAFCAIFPFTLILYGHGILDTAIVYWTEGEIRHFGRRQKTLAKVLGWGGAVTTILTVVILFIIIRTVPNDFPR